MAWTDDGIQRSLWPGRLRLDIEFYLDRAQEASRTHGRSWQRRRESSNRRSDRLGRMARSAGPCARWHQLSLVSPSLAGASQDDSPSKFQFGQSHESAKRVQHSYAGRYGNGKHSESTDKSTQSDPRFN